MLRYVIARMIGTAIGLLLRPLLRVGSALLLLWIGVWLPGLMWRSFVDHRASGSQLTTINFAAWGVVLTLWALWCTVNRCRQSAARRRSRQP